MLNIPNESLQDYVQHIGSLCNILNRRSNIPFGTSAIFLPTLQKCRESVPEELILVRFFVFEACVHRSRK